jgi:hypothetical protein
LAGYLDRRLVFRAAESPAFCPRRSAAPKCRGQCRPGDRSRPWTGTADRSTSDFPSFRLRKDHYCRRWVDSRVGTRAEKVPAAQRVDPTALAQLGSRVLRQLRRQQQHSVSAFYFSKRTGPITTLVTGRIMSARVAGLRHRRWRDATSAPGSPSHGRALGLPWEIENNARSPLPRTAAENVSIHNVS